MCAATTSRRKISTDSINADRLRTHANELKSGLESRGLESDSVHISSSGEQRSQQGPRDRSSGAREWEDKQAAREEQRAQHRDAQGRGSGNQDRKRPQYQEKQ